MNPILKAQTIARLTIASDVLRDLAKMPDLITAEFENDVLDALDRLEKLVDKMELPKRKDL